jgi:hypothetical protein
MVICGGADINGVLLGGCYVLLPATAAGQPWVIRQVVNPGVLPARRDGVAVVVNNQWLLLYGGNSTDRSLATPEVLTIGTWDIDPAAAFTGDVPTARYAHTAVLSPVDGRSWIIFGGAAYSDDSLLDDVAVLDLGDGTAPAFAFSAPTVTGTKPAARRYHAAAALGGVMYVSGGLKAGDVACSDLFALALSGSNMWLWKQQDTVFSTPIYGHSLFVSGSLLVVYGAIGSDGLPPADAIPNGGIMDLSTADWNWRVPDIDTSRVWPQAYRPVAALLTHMQDGGGDRIVTYGGGVPLGPTPGETNTFDALSGIGVTPPPPHNPSKLPLVLGGCAVGVFLLLLAGGIVWWRRGRAREAGVQLQPGYVRRSALLDSDVDSEHARSRHGSRGSESYLQPALPHMASTSSFGSAADGALYLLAGTQGRTPGSGSKRLAPHIRAGGAAAALLSGSPVSSAGAYGGGAYGSMSPVPGSGTGPSRGTAALDSGQRGAGGAEASSGWASGRGTLGDDYGEGGDGEGGRRGAASSSDSVDAEIDSAYAARSGLVLSGSGLAAALRQPSASFSAPRGVAGEADSQFPPPPISEGIMDADDDEDSERAGGTCRAADGGAFEGDSDEEVKAARAAMRAGRSKRSRRSEDEVQLRFT